MSEHVDVLIVGAGLSGIGAAHHTQAAFPDKTYTILEARDAIGGTWDLFRYPGVRSDSDMFTLGYRFRPWTQAEAVADGPSILGYVRDTAAEAAIDKNIRFNHRVTRASWSSAMGRWTVQALHGAETRTLTCDFLLMCSGYYRYDEGYLPQFAGISDFRGLVVHPQHWPANLDYAGQRIVVTGGHIHRWGQWGGVAHVGGHPVRAFGVAVQDNDLPAHPAAFDQRQGRRGPDGASSDHSDLHYPPPPRIGPPRPLPARAGLRIPGEALPLRPAR